MPTELLVHFDSAKPLDSNSWIEVRGWVAGDQPIDSISIPLTVQQSVDLEQRPDVAAALPHKSHIAGFSARLKRDTVDLNTLNLSVQSDGNPQLFPVTWSEGNTAETKSFPTPRRSDDKTEKLRQILTIPGTNHRLSTEQVNAYWNGDRYNFLPDSLSEEMKVDSFDYESAHGYPAPVLQLIEESSSGLILDCGAGLRKTLFDQVINFEPVPYPSTDVQGIAEALPFAENSFDAVVSLSVLEHVKDPKTAASEMVRVLKPGGIIHLEVPFLIQEHGYPHHYYNMTAQGLANLVTEGCEILEQEIPDYGHPIHALVPLLQTWSEHLNDRDKDEFEKMTIGELIKNYDRHYEPSWASNLPQSVQRRIATVTRLVATKK